jgi:hypothetical protein
LSPRSRKRPGSRVIDGFSLTSTAALTGNRFDIVESFAQAFEGDRVGHGQSTLDDVHDDLWNPAFGQLDDEGSRPMRRRQACSSRLRAASASE